MRVKALLLALAIGCGGGAAAPEKPEPVKVATPEEVIQAGRGLVEKYRQGYEVRSLEALSALYSQTVDTVVVHQGQAHLGWNGVAEYLRDILSRATEVHVKAGAIAVTAIGNQGAAISAELDRSISDGVTTIEEKGVLTLTIRREGAAWLIVHEHFSYRPKAP